MAGLLSRISLVSEGWSQWPGLNRRPTVYETVALPLSYIGNQHCLNLPNYAQKTEDIFDAPRLIGKPIP